MQKPVNFYKLKREQSESRMHRKGQSEPVFIHHITARDKADAVAVLDALKRKKQ